MTGKNSLTLESLSEKLELRLNTVWAFKQKVLARVADFNRKKATVGSWEEIVMDFQKEKPKKVTLPGSQENQLITN